jgi:hypothetical protein
LEAVVRAAMAQVELMVQIRYFLLLQQPLVVVVARQVVQVEQAVDRVVAVQALQDR